MTSPVLALQLITIANITLERQAIFESLTHRTHTDQSDHTDYVVVGAGTTGSVVAPRLSENPKHKVLLIESGGEQSVESDIPALFNFDFRTKQWMNFNIKQCLKPLLSIESLSWFEANIWALRLGSSLRCR
jgi:choline dehydrogenase-like flavoprotein